MICIHYTQYKVKTEINNFKIPCTKMIELKALDIMQYCSLYSLVMSGNTCDLLEVLGAYRTYVFGV